MKVLRVATDIYDEVHHNERFYGRRHFQDLMAYCRSLGATGIDWVLDDIWTLYDDYPGGFDLLKTAIDAAHAEGMEFTVVYKPFEGVLAHLILPHTMPRPEGAVVWEDLRGLVPIVRPFVAAHPEMCLRRRPGDEDTGGRLRAIRLVKDDDVELDVSADAFSIWTGRTNGRLRRWPGEFQLNQCVEWRPLFPLGRSCRILTLDGLDIPASERYIEVRLAEGALGGRGFRNEYAPLVELVGQNGDVIPSMTAAAEPPREHYVKLLGKPWMRRLVRYARLPEVEAFLEDEEKISEEAGDLHAYVRDVRDPQYALDERRSVAVARGKAPYLAGILNPMYPEVRAEWLRIVQFCVDRGADAVDFRVSSHLNQQEKWAYGYNEPVMRALGGGVNMAESERVMGDAFTQFLQEARDLLHANGRRIGVHLLSNFLRARDEGAAGPTHHDMEWQWETWVAEIADFAVFRGAMGIREQTLHYVVDAFATACRRRGIPLIYQSNRRSYVGGPDRLHFDPDKLEWLRYEMAYALGHWGIDGYQFYETANFTCLDGLGAFHGSEQIRAAARQFGFTPG